MITAIVLLILICAPCLFGACAGIRFERTLPLVTMGMAALLFLSGIAGDLFISFCLILLLSAGALAFSAVRATRQKKWRETLSRFFTPSFFCFIAAAAAVAYCYYGIAAYNQDEMSHWLFVVKAMTYLDDFGTSSATRGMMWYASYPPGMALMQYFTARLDTLLRPGREFADWLSYYTYHVFAVSMLIPLSPGSGCRRWWKNAVFLALMMTLSATVFRQEIFSVLIDPYVGIVTGAGFLAVIFTEKKDALYRAYMCLICAMIVLSKDVGLAAGLAVSVVYLIDELGSGRVYSVSAGKLSARGSAAAAMPMASALCAKALWALEVYTSGARVKYSTGFSEKADYLYYAKIFFFGGDGTYYQKVADNYKNELIRGSFFSFGGLDISIGAVFIGCCLASALLYTVLIRAGKDVSSGNSFSGGKNFRVMVADTAAAALYCGVYIFNIGAVYMYNFFDYEALRLASLWRYAGMALLPLLMLTAGLFLYTADRISGKTAGESGTASGGGNVSRRVIAYAAYSLTVVCVLFLLVSSEAVRDVTSRRLVAGSHERLSCYVPLTEKIKSECTVDDRIYVIIQGKDNVSTNGLYDNMAIRMMIYPIYIEDHAHSLGKQEDGRFPREDIPYEQWLDDIMENCDYVAVYYPDNQLGEIYGEAFEDGPDIQPGSLYRVNREKRLLEPAGTDRSAS